MKFDGREGRICRGLELEELVNLFPTVTLSAREVLLGCWPILRSQRRTVHSQLQVVTLVILGTTPILGDYGPQAHPVRSNKPTKL